LAYSANLKMEATCYSETLLIFKALRGVISQNMPVTVAERSKAYTVFARSEAGIVNSNPTQGMDV
jgi:hypothetical protein